jgi:hypothetical protein
VATRVVDDLEVVDVDQDQRERQVHPLRHLELAGQLVLERSVVAQAGEPVHERVVPGAAVQALELVALRAPARPLRGDRHAEPGEQERQSERGQQQNDRGDPGMAGVLVREGSDRRHADEDAERQRQRPDQAGGGSVRRDQAPGRAGPPMWAWSIQLVPWCGSVMVLYGWGDLGRCEPKVPGGPGDLTTDVPDGVAYRRQRTRAHEGRPLLRDRTRRPTGTLARAGIIGAGLCLLAAFVAAPPVVEAASCKGGSHAAPVLSAGKASPGSGTTATTITFSVKYKDAAGCAPTAIAVVIQGVGQYAMSGPGSGFAGGVTFVVSGRCPGQLELRLHGVERNRRRRQVDDPDRNVAEPRRHHRPDPAADPEAHAQADAEANAEAAPPPPEANAQADAEAAAARSRRRPRNRHGHAAPKPVQPPAATTAPSRAAGRPFAGGGRTDPGDRVR